MNLRRVFRGIILFTTILSLAVCAQGATRIVLLEGFTQWNCGPCALWNPTETPLLTALTRDTVLAIKYHGWWPGSNNDAFYLYNTAENAARINYYSINAVPDVRIDGVVDPNVNAGDLNGSRTRVRNAIYTRYEMPAPCSIEMSAYPVGTTEIAFCGTLSAELDLPPSRLRVVLITNNVTYGSAPGSNGERSFDNIFRDVYPDAAGELISSLPLGETYSFGGTLNKLSAWDTDDLTVIAFLQDEASAEIYQAAYTDVVAGYGMTATCDDPSQRLVAPDGGEISYTIDLANVGSMTDSYLATLIGHFPTGWTHTIEADNVPPDPDNVFIQLDGGATATVTVRVNPNGYPGSLDFQAMVQSDNLPSCSMNKRFRLMSQPDILLVDDDGGASYGNIERFFSDCAESVVTDHSWGWWDAQAGSLDAELLADIPLVVWFTGRCQNGQTLTTDEQTLLTNYLDAGGRLFLSGQGIAFDIRASVFMAEKLHAALLATVPTNRTVNGIAGESMSEGLTLSISGGDGANNQSRQNSIRALAGAEPIWRYPNQTLDSCAGLKVAADNYALVFLPFGFEAISSSETRDDVMGRALGWLLGTLTAEPQPVAATPHEFMLGQNYPNPFNPETVIPYTLPARGQVTLSVYDLLGREVTTLVSGPQEAGAHAVAWNAGHMASGLYFYRLDVLAGAASYHATRKLMLLK